VRRNKDSWRGATRWLGGDGTLIHMERLMSMVGWKYVVLMVLLVIVILWFAGNMKREQKISPQIDRSIEAAIPTSTIIKCDKSDNCCVQNEDCQYISYTGGCNTPEYVAKIQKEAEKKGLRNGEAPLRKNVTCTCESSKCVTHN
jgi:hypothetical protein